jgi:3-oxoacyl-[acyl-carrier-protein] synthase I
MQTPDPEIPISPTSRNRAARIDRVMSNSFGFGGINVSLVLGRLPNGIRA